jgi:hypothetical protein
LIALLEVDVAVPARQAGQVGRLVEAVEAQGGAGEVVTTWLASPEKALWPKVHSATSV